MSGRCDGWHRRRPARRARAGICLALLFAALARANPPPLEAFAARPALEDPTVSPDGRYLATIQSVRDRTFVAVLDRTARRRASWTGVLGESGPWRLRYCRWVAARRLVCGLRGMVRQGERVYAAGQLVGVDADGGGLRVLFASTLDPDQPAQSQVIDWNPGIPDAVLVEAAIPLPLIAAREVIGQRIVVPADQSAAYPGVFALDIRTGRLTPFEPAHPPIRHFITDGHGHARLATGLDGQTYFYFARAAGETRWRLLASFPAFSRDKALRPIAISDVDLNQAYAVGDAGGRAGLWLIDLLGATAPSLVFAHAAVDVGPPLLTDRGKLLGFYYETERPHLEYIEPTERGFLASIDRLLPGAFNFISDMSRDRAVIILRSISDVDEGSYYLADAARPSLQRLGRANPDLAPESLAPVQPYVYAARDGVPVPAFLVLPRDLPARALPLVVLPHGGPLQRDGWRYFFLRSFLASRGYAVLSANFRGSTGYGREWQYSAHQDWGGLSYRDVVDGVAPLVASGTVDPARVAIVGWSFGGYLAALAAVRGESSFRCAVSVAGISDLGLFLEQARGLPEAGLLAAEVGTDPEHLYANSPRFAAASIGMPLLLLHGDRDAQVQVQQSDLFATALKRAGGVHRYVRVSGADHQFSGLTDRRTLLHEIEAFLGTCLAPASP